MGWEISRKKTLEHFPHWGQNTLDRRRANTQNSAQTPCVQVHPTQEKAESLNLDQAFCLQTWLLSRSANSLRGRQILINHITSQMKIKITAGPGRRDG